MTKRGRVQVRKYFELPEEVLLDSEKLRIWANEAVNAATKTQPIKVIKQTRKKCIS